MLALQDRITVMALSSLALNPISAVLIILRITVPVIVHGIDCVRLHIMAYTLFRASSSPIPIKVSPSLYSICGCTNITRIHLFTVGEDPVPLHLTVANRFAVFTARVVLFTHNPAT